VRSGEHDFTALVSSPLLIAPRAYGSPLAAAQGFNAELDRARRDGLASDPEPARLSEAALLAAVRASHG
jgi:hypothetical protein